MSMLLSSNFTFGSAKIMYVFVVHINVNEYTERLLTLLLIVKKNVSFYCMLVGTGPFFRIRTVI